MKETRKQKLIKSRRDNIYNDYLATTLSTTEFVDKAAKKNKISTVTVYADLKAKKLEIEVNAYIEKMGYTWTFQSIMKQYKASLQNEYISHTAKDVIEKAIKPNL